MVGGLGTWAISAVGLISPAKIYSAMTMSRSINVGATALVAQATGAGRQEKARSYTRQALLLNLLLAILVSITGFLFSRPMVRFMGAADEHILNAGTAYLQIQMASFLFFTLTSVITAVFRGIGDSKTAMYYNSIANLVNIILNYLLIGGKMGFPRLEVAGASYATAISQIVAWLPCIFRYRQKIMLSSHQPEGFVFACCGGYP